MKKVKLEAICTSEKHNLKYFIFLYRIVMKEVSWGHYFQILNYEIWKLDSYHVKYDHSKSRLQFTYYMLLQKTD